MIKIKKKSHFKMLYSINTIYSIIDSVCSIDTIIDNRLLVVTNYFFHSNKFD